MHKNRSLTTRFLNRRINVIALCLLAIALSTPLASAKERTGGYLFAHMTSEDYGRLYYSVSEDGLHWTQLNDGQRIYEDYRGHPDLTYGHDERYYILGGSRTVDIWVSDDLITWELYLKFDPDVTLTPDFEPAESIHGAPKMFFDREAGTYLITWHTSQHKRDKENPNHYWNGQRTLYVTSTDLKTFSEPRRLFQYDMATIDVIVRKIDGRYHAILKDERYPSFDWPTGKSIRQASSDHLTGPWTEPSEPIVPNFREAPTLIPRPAGDGWYIYTEQYPGVQYNLTTAPSIDGPWYQVYIKEYAVPVAARHGCMIPVTAEQMTSIKAAFPHGE